MKPPIDALLTADEPWVRWGARTVLLGAPHDDPDVIADRTAALGHPDVRARIEHALSWPGPVLKRHNQATHPLHSLGLVPDLGLSVRNPDGRTLADRLLDHIGADGLPRCLIELPTVFGGTGKPEWDWMLCDTPLLLDCVQSLGLDDDLRVCTGLDALADLSTDAGWLCASSFPGVRGPGRKADPCPYANLVSLRALSHSPQHRDTPATRASTEVLLGHWQTQADKKLRMFGIGTTFRRLKYPFVWYDLMHALEVLTRFEWTHDDPRLHEMLGMLVDGADPAGLYKPGSVWMAFKGFDFAQKRGPSPTLTLAAWRIRCRVGG